MDKALCAQALFIVHHLVDIGAAVADVGVVVAEAAVQKALRGVAHVGVAAGVDGIVEAGGAHGLVDDAGVFIIVDALHEGGAVGTLVHARAVDGDDERLHAQQMCIRDRVLGVGDGDGQKVDAILAQQLGEHAEAAALVLEKDGDLLDEHGSPPFDQSLRLSMTRLALPSERGMDLGATSLTSVEMPTTDLMRSWMVRARP